MTHVTLAGLRSLQAATEQPSFFTEQALALTKAASLAALSLSLALLITRALSARKAGRNTSVGIRRIVVLAGIVSISLAMVPGRHETMWRRVETLRQTTEGWRRTHRTLTYVSGDSILRGSRDDDPGLYLLAPLYVRTNRRPDAVATDTAIASAASMLVVWLLLLTALTRAGVAPFFGIAALPPVTALAFLSRHGDIYWVPGAVAALAVLLLFSETRLRHHTFSAAWFCFGTLAAIATVFRGTVGSIAIGATLLAIFAHRSDRPTRQWVRLSALLVVLVLPRAITAVALGDTLPGSSIPTSAIRTSHPFWHSVYLGLGVINNPWHIRYTDMDAVQYARSVNPGVELFSPAYETILENRLASILRENPAFIFEQLLAKCTLLAMFLAGGLVLIRVAFRRWRRGGEGRVFLTVWLSQLLVTCVPSLLVVPSLPYLLATFATLVTGGALLIADDVAPNTMRSV